MWLEVPDDLPTGAIVAVAKITGYCEAAKDNPWFIGPYGWQLAEVLELDSPIPCRRALGLWKLDNQLQRKLKSTILETVY